MRSARPARSSSLTSIRCRQRSTSRIARTSCPRRRPTGYLDEVARICEYEDIRLVIPTIDDELELFGAARARFEEAGVLVAVSHAATASICNDKLATCERLRAHGIAAAPTWVPSTLPVDVAFPLFVKPRGGRGGVGAYRVERSPRTGFLLVVRGGSRRAGVPRRSRVHDRRAVRFQRPAAFRSSPGSAWSSARA